MTGVVLLSSNLGAKRLGLLRQLLPNVEAVGVIVNPTYPVAAAQLKEVEAAAASLNVRLIVTNASADHDFEPAFALLIQQRVGALLVAADPFFHSRRHQIVALAARHALPAIYEWREYSIAGGLMSYGTSITEVYRLAGVYVGRVLKGEKTADLPVIQASKFEFVINLRTAKALGLEVPLGFLPPPTRSSNEAPPVHHAAGRHGCGVAARGARAAGACSSRRRASWSRRDGIVTGLAHRLLASAR